jgi:tRNA A37 threonylcarbamoyladenosine modification protein TsaB
MKRSTEELLQDENLMKKIFQSQDSKDEEKVLSLIEAGMDEVYAVQLVLSQSIGEAAWQDEGTEEDLEKTEELFEDLMARVEALRSEDKK